MQCQDININTTNPNIDVKVDHSVTNVKYVNPSIQVENNSYRVNSDINRPTVEIQLNQQGPAGSGELAGGTDGYILFKKTDISGVYEWKKQIDFQVEYFTISDETIFDFVLLNIPITFSESVIINGLEQDSIAQYNISGNTVVFNEDIGYVNGDTIKIKYAY